MSPELVTCSPETSFLYSREWTFLIHARLVRRALPLYVLVLARAPLLLAQPRSTKYPIAVPMGRSYLGNTPRDCMTNLLTKVLGMQSLM